MRREKCHPGRRKWVKIPLLPNNVSKNSVSDSGPTVGSRQSQTAENQKKIYKQPKKKCVCLGVVESILGML